MRTIVDIPEQELEKLRLICEQEEISRAEAIRRALGLYTEQYPKKELGSAFGLWKDRCLEGLAYEDQVRTDWDRDESDF